MKYLIAVSVFFISLSVASATEFKLRSGKKGDIKIDFPYGSVNGQVFWNQNNFDSAVATIVSFATAPAPTTVLITPTQFEFNLTTCTLSGFTTADEYREAQTYKGILPYIDELKVRVDSMNLVGGHGGLRADMQARLDYLISQAKILP